MANDSGLWKLVVYPFVAGIVFAGLAYGGVRWLIYFAHHIAWK